MKRSVIFVAVAIAAIFSFALVNSASAQTTEYLVRADGALTVLSGSVDVNYNSPGGGGSTHASVPAGFSFDPVTGQVVPTSPAFLQSIIADIIPVKKSAQTFKVSGGAIVKVKPTSL